MSNADQIKEFVYGKIQLLQENNPWSKAMLAKLRRGIGKEPSGTPEIWEITLKDIPENLINTGYSDSYQSTEAENAIHTALTLYALHQQGSVSSMSTNSKSFASAVRDLILPSKDNADAVKRRFDAVITSGDLVELSHHARGLIQMMRSADVPIRLDYPMFAKDLYFYQFDEGKSNVRLSWGQDFYKVNQKSEKNQ